jgi:hypothetical protein
LKLCEAAAFVADNQISALSFASDFGSGRVKAVLIATWVDNRLVVLHARMLTLLYLIDLGLSHARSLLLYAFGESAWLLAGQADGCLLAIEVDSARSELRIRARFQVGRSEVTLFGATDADGAAIVYAHADGAAAILRANPLGGIPICRRVHSAESLQCVCAVHTASLPDSLAWLTSQGQLGYCCAPFRKPPFPSLALSRLGAPGHGMSPNREIPDGMVALLRAQVRQGWLSSGFELAETYHFAEGRAALRCATHGPMRL